MPKADCAGAGAPNAEGVVLAAVALLVDPNADIDWVDVPKADGVLAVC